MGKKCTTVGYGYDLTFGYAFCERADAILGFKFDGKSKWTGEVSVSGEYFESMTGKKGNKYKSDYGKTKVYCYFGDQTYSPYVHEDYPVCYKKLAWLYFPTAFIGDNVTSIPRYQARWRHLSFYNGTYMDVEGEANAAYVIYYILNTMLKIDTQLIDLNSFEYAAQILHQEKFGISFVMTREKKTIDWIKEILRTIDGAVYYSPTDGKYKIKLFRDDYDKNNLPVYDEVNTKGYKIERGSWSDVVTTFNFKFTNPDNGKADSIVIYNNAALTMVGYVKQKEFSFMMIQGSHARKNVINRVIKKQGYPLATLRMKVNIMEAYDLVPGSVFIFKNDKYGLPARVYRVITVGGDKEDTLDLEISAIEDLFSLDVDLSQDFDPGGDTTEQHNITSAPTENTTYEMGNEFTNDEDEGYVPIAPFPNRSEVITSLTVDTPMKSPESTSVWYKYTLNEAIDSSYVYDNTKEVEVTDSNSMYFFFNLNEEDFQKGMMIGYIEGTIWAFKSVVQVSGTTYKLVRPMCLSKKHATYPAGTTVYLLPNAIEDLTLFEFEYDYLSSESYNIWYSSPLDEGPAISASHTKTYAARYPLPPSNLSYFDDGDSYRLKFSPAVRLGGASYDSCDDIMAGADEGTTEGEFKVYKNGTHIHTITSPIIVDGYVVYDLGNYGSGTYKVTCVLPTATSDTQYESEGIEITIP